MREFFDYIAKEVGEDSLEYSLLKQYVNTKEDVSHFNKIAMTLCECPLYGQQPLINAVLYYIEDKILAQTSMEQWHQVYDSAFESKQGLLDLIREDGIDSYDDYKFVEEYFSDEMVRDFMKNHFSGDLEALSHELVEYYNQLYPNAC